MSNNKRSNSLLVVVTFMVVLLSCSLTNMFSKSNDIVSIGDTPPYYGYFYIDDGTYIELPEKEISGRVYDYQLEDIPIVNTSRPSILLWNPEVVFDYLTLLSVEEQEHLDFTTKPLGEDLYELMPSSSLLPGKYCFIQGNPLAVFLSSWCFSYGSPVSQNNSVTPAEDSEDKPPLPSPTIEYWPSSCDGYGNDFKVNEVVNELIQPGESVCYRVEPDPFVIYLLQINPSPDQLSEYGSYFVPEFGVYPPVGLSILKSYTDVGSDYKYRPFVVLSLIPEESGCVMVSNIFSPLKVASCECSVRGNGKEAPRPCSPTVATDSALVSASSI